MDTCAPEPGVHYLCGLANPEDILRIGDSHWLLASGMAGEPDINGRLHLIDARDGSWEALFPGPMPLAYDAGLYPDCPGPLQAEPLSLHGLALQNHPPGSSSYRLYMTSHGAREAIETFRIDLLDKPTLTWTGCVPLPDTVWANSVVILPDGGFLATKFMDPGGAGFQAILAGELNGHVLLWHPGGDVNALPGTELSGPNGIALSNDGNQVFVTAFGGDTIVRFDLDAQAPTRTEAALGVTPDNLRWSTDGRLLTAGGNVEGACFDAEGMPCGPGWSVLAIDPATLQAVRLGGMGPNPNMPAVSTALQVGNEIWTGSPRGDRIAILPAP